MIFSNLNDSMIIWKHQMSPKQCSGLLMDSIVPPLLLFTKYQQCSCPGFPCVCISPWCSFVLRSPLTALQMAFFCDKLPMSLMCCLSRLSLWSLCNLVMFFEVFFSLQMFRPVNVTSCDMLLSCRDHINSLTNTRSRLRFNTKISGTFRKVFLLQFYQWQEFSLFNQYEAVCLDKILIKCKY